MLAIFDGFLFRKWPPTCRLSLHAPCYPFWQRHPTYARFSASLKIKPPFTVFSTVIQLSFLVYLHQRVTIWPPRGHNQGPTRRRSATAERRPVQPWLGHGCGWHKTRLEQDGVLGTPTNQWEYEQDVIRRDQHRGPITIR